MRGLRLVGSLTLFLGACLSGRALYLQGKATLAGILIRIAWEESLRSGEDRRPWPWADTHPVGRLRIPRLGYDEIVLEGASPRNLAFGPARVWGGAAPGEPGHLVLAGHRTSWFLPLQDMRLGDRILIEWRGVRPGARHQHAYVVDALRIAPPEAVTALLPTAEDRLSLVTCYPFGPWPTSPMRFVVRARPAEPLGVDAGRLVAAPLDVLDVRARVEVRLGLGA